MVNAVGCSVFISYRRADSQDVAARLADRFRDRFGEDRVFIDVPSLGPGVDYVDATLREAAKCDVLIAVIGPDWLSAADPRGRRLDNPRDLVRREIKAALDRGVRVIPVLLEDVVMPRRQDLPKVLAGLARRNALQVRYGSFAGDAERLVKAVEEVLDSPARLLKKAERVANSIPNEYEKGRALAAATTVPGEAERILNAIFHYFNSFSNILNRLNDFNSFNNFNERNAVSNKFNRQYALDVAALATAPSDLREVRRIANNIPDLSEAARLATTFASKDIRSRALDAVAVAMAPSDPGEAERVANNIPDLSVRRLALGSVAVTAAPTHPAEAERIANNIDIPSDRTWVLVGVSLAVAVNDPGEAERIANNIPDLTRKVDAFIGIAVAIALTDPREAERFFGEAERFADFIPEKLAMIQALIRIATTLSSFRRRDQQ